MVVRAGIEPGILDYNSDVVLDGETQCNNFHFHRSLLRCIVGNFVTAVTAKSVLFSLLVDNHSLSDLWPQLAHF